MPLTIKVKKLSPEARLPKYAHPGDAGMDVYAISKNETDKYVEYGTGLSFELPPDHMLLLYPRSSVANTDLLLANSVGVIDSGYRGELKVRFRKSGDNDYAVGDRIAQIIILPFPQVEFSEAAELSASQRGAGAFGSTGINTIL
ncbi:MAG: dUTP diphosphatase [Patescibacteria group bacterium]|jgi:dUTP pyrophosphatase